ncbi:type II toxin-antitoxin system mRNA interferase toxin, RelE/StbE family [Candidatus Peregrinibacteria bacterium]|nr:type II toxin-antitoxin system mRNA interferase toxin, RelE/StbE family [Candidatus Peregrinibacteria bacterium]
MKIKKIIYTSHFKRALKKLPESIKKQMIQKEKLFRANCFDPRLKTHKLNDPLSEYWSFSVNHSTRTLFSFETNEETAFIDIGPHSIY